MQKQNSSAFSLLLIPGLILTIYWGFEHGAPGIVAGLFITIFLVMGLGGILLGGPIASAAAVFFWFIGFVIVEMAMVLFEMYSIDDGQDLGKKFGPGGDYFADKVMDIISNGLSSAWAFIHADHSILKFVYVLIGAGVVILWLLSRVLIRK